MTELDAGPYPTPPTPLRFDSAHAVDVTPRHWVSSTVDVDGVDTLEPLVLEVEVEVRHPRAGGLALWLQAPSGSYFRLRTADGLDLRTPPERRYEIDISHEFADGGWLLWAYDAYSDEDGLLQRWRITF